MSYPEESLYWKGRGMDSSQSEPVVRGGVYHTHRRGVGRVLAIVPGYAVVEWPGWDKPDLSPLSDLRAALLETKP